MENSPGTAVAQPHPAVGAPSIDDSMVAVRRLNGHVASAPTNQIQESSEWLGGGGSGSAVLNTIGRRGGDLSPLNSRDYLLIP